MGYRQNRKRFDDWLSRLEPTKFESMLAEYFRDQTYRVEHVGAAVQGRRFDGGIDLKLYKDSEYIIVQCKNWNAMQVTHNAVHELLGVMLTQRASGAMVVSSGEFTAHAITSAAEDRRMRLIDGVELRRLLATWPGRARWANTGGGVLSRFGFSGIISRMRAVAKLAAFAIAFLIFALVAVAIFGPRGLKNPSQAPALATTAEPVLEASTGEVSRPVPGAPNTPVQLTRQAMTWSERRRAARSGIHALGDVTQRVTASAMGAADPYRSIDPESARIVVGAISGVRSAVWIDETNFIVRVDSAGLRSMATINEVCAALEPLGDTLGVVVALQNANARNGDEMETLTRNCQLAEGRRAYGQRKRQIDTVSPEVRAQFKAMQERNQRRR